MQPNPKIQQCLQACADWGLIPTEFKQCMTWEEQVLWLFKFLNNTVIPTLNRDIENIEALAADFAALETYVQDYFTNLDVQVQINNKLDQMANDGSLTALISAYVDPIINAFKSEVSNSIAAQNTAISDIRGEVEGIASGSPAGVYATAAALAAADPDHSKIYLVSADGKWYYYANSQWNAGGVYQAAVLTLDNSLTKTTDAPVSSVVGKALANINATKLCESESNTTYEWESGTISSDGSVITESKRIRTTKFIFAKAGSLITCESGYKFGYAIYTMPMDASFVSRTNINDNDKTVANDCYIRIIMGTSDESVIADPTTVYPKLHYYIIPAVSATEYEKDFNPVVESGIWTKTAGGESIIPNTNNSHAEVSVTPGDIVHIKYTYMREEYSLNYLDSDRSVVSQPLQGDNSGFDMYNIVPAGAVTMIVNYNVNYDFKLAKVEKINDVVNLIKPAHEKFTILHSNVGGFNYPSGSTTPAQYIKNWKQMLNDQDADMIACCEWSNSYNSQDMNSELIAPLMRSNNKGNSDRLLTSYKGNITNLGVLTVTRTVDDLTTYAYHALKNKIMVGEKEVIIYEVHLAYSAGYEALRQAQYQDLIDDVAQNNYEYVIFSGDFNAQTIDEYDIFKNNGYVLCNGGYTGEYDTLRDITADNIIFSPNIKLNRFEVVEGYNLNTDHKPIRATLSI